MDEDVGHYWMSSLIQQLRMIETQERAVYVCYEEIKTSLNISGEAELSLMQPCVL